MKNKFRNRQRSIDRSIGHEEYSLRPLFREMAETLCKVFRNDRTNDDATVGAKLKILQLCLHFISNPSGVDDDGVLCVKRKRHLVKTASNHGALKVEGDEIWLLPFMHYLYCLVIS